MDRLKRQEAFSLIEVMISLVILMVGVMGLAVAFQRSIYQANSARNDTTAMMIAQGIVDELSTLEFDDLSSSIAGIEDKFRADFQGLYLDDPNAGDLYYVPTISITETLPARVTVEVRVNWTGWQGELEEGGYGKGPASFAFVMNVSLSRDYGEQAVSTI